MNKKAKRMIQFILMLIGLEFPNNSTITTINNQAPYAITTSSGAEQGINDGGPVGGNSGQTPPAP